MNTSAAVLAAAVLATAAFAGCAAAPGPRESAPTPRQTGPISAGDRVVDPSCADRALVENCTALTSAVDAVKAGAFDLVGQYVITRTAEGGFESKATFRKDLNVPGAYDSLDATLRNYQWTPIEKTVPTRLVYRDPVSPGYPQPTVTFTIRQENPATERPVLIDMVATLPPPGG